MINNDSMPEAPHGGDVPELCSEQMNERSTILPQTDGLSLVAAVMRVSESAPERVALWFEGQSCSYADWVALIQTCQRSLLALGVQPGDRVACLAWGHPLQLAVLMALSDLGGIWVPLNFRLAQAEWQQVLADCTPCLLLTDEHWQAHAQALANQTAARLALLESLRSPPETGAESKGLGADSTDPHRPALLVYTSGTTGRPKGAVHTLANLCANAQAAMAGLGVGPGDRVLTLLPLFHVGGLCIQTLPALLSGATVVLHPRFDADAAWRDLVKHRITLTLMVPAVMKALIEHPAFAPTRLPDLKAIWAGSSVLPRDLVQAWHDRGIPVCNVYGATETGPFSLALGPQHARTHVGSCGWPALHVQARIDAPGPDGVGEVCLRGPAVVSQYWPQQPALDEQGWFHTGDLACMEADQSWRIVGRAKDMIISGGENIYPAEIEQVLARHPALAECAVVGLPDERWGEQVVAVVVFKAGQMATPQELLAPVKAALAKYKHPRQLWVHEGLPKTALGKVQKDELARQLSGPPVDKAAVLWADSPRSA
jgi:fatty-acyl-CoA synthase